MRKITLRNNVVTYIQSIREAFVSSSQLFYNEMEFSTCIAPGAFEALVGVLNARDPAGVPSHPSQRSRRHWLV